MSKDSSNKRRKAAAIHYDREKEGDVPRLTAKGEGKVADRIIAIAEEHGVPITRDPDLYTLLSRLDIGQSIHPDLYEVVAELLVFIYSVKQEWKRKQEKAQKDAGEDSWEASHEPLAEIDEDHL